MSKSKGEGSGESMTEDKQRAVGVNMYERQLDRIEGMIGEYGSRSAFIRDMTVAAIDVYEMAQQHDERIMPHELDDFIRDAAEYYLKNKDSE